MNSVWVVNAYMHYEGGSDIWLFKTEQSARNEEKILRECAVDYDEIVVYQEEVDD